MARFELENIDRDFFWELVDEGYASYSIIDAYLYMLSQKLSKDTDIRFRVENGYLYNDEILFVSDIGSVEITATFEDKHRESVNYYCPKYFLKSTLV